MSARITFRTAGRILRQLTHDPRTIALLLVAPVLLMTLLRYLFDAHPFDRVGWCTGRLSFRSSCSC